ncbi:MAG: hypothetical protein K2J83_06785 [Clostridia bacterium]|nr:hypothetical protein [Clostridia bacterium]
MRKLTVIRRKSHVSCLAGIKIYIQDPDGDTRINGVNCKFLGKLKNGQSATFEIGNESLKLFAIYDELSKDFCQNYYTVPAGESNLVVSGAPQLDSLRGNPFYFDGVTDIALLEERKSNKKKTFILTISGFIVALTGVVIAMLCWLR